MCGVAGFIGDANIGSAFLRSSITCLKHRGPDGEGQISLNWSGLSHVRLALISPGPEGSQPVEGERYIISFNGEIYNWREIAKELNLGGYDKTLKSDTQVLLHSIEVWGLIETLTKVRGIFAFALLDKLENSLLLVRDAAGTKPIYYTQKSTMTFFASEIKAFTEFNLNIDNSQLKEYLTFQNTLGSKTIFEGVFLVPQGSVLIFRNPDQEPELIEWDHGYFRSESELSAEKSLAHLEDLLVQAVRRSLVADASVGAFLSGGIDSTLISMIAHEENDELDYFTLGFSLNSQQPPQGFYDERIAASNLASHFKMRHHTSEIDPHMFEENFDAICWAVEEPRVGQSYPNYFATKFAASKVKAVLSGAGGDELFAGYPWRYASTLESAHLGKQAQLESYLKIWHRLGSVNTISRLIGSNAVEHRSNSINSMQVILEKNSQNKSKYELQDILYFEYKTFLNGLLIVDDKIAMSQGVEIRVPFLDQDVVRFAQNLPNQFRLGGLQKSSNLEGKLLLRNLASKMQNPRAAAPKQGFTGPDESWFKNENRNFVKMRLLNRDAILWNHLDYETGSNLINEHFNGLKNHRSLIWSLISLESTFQKFL